MSNVKMGKIDTMILLATYNGELYLKEQLESLLNQTYQNFICYIHDDNSKDNTKKIIDEYCRMYPDKFFELNYESGHGAVGNFSSMIDYACRFCNEKYIFFCDQDDVWLPNKIEIELIELKRIDTCNSEKPILVYCDQKLVDSNLDIFAESSREYLNYDEKSESFKHLVFENCAAGCTIAINRKLLKMCSFVSNTQNVVMHDWILMLIASAYGIVKYVDMPLMLYRQHNNNTLGAERRTLNVKMVKYMSDFFGNASKKRKHIKQCEKQAMELKKLADCYGHVSDIEECFKICQKNKAYRMFYFFKKGYIERNNMFTLLFV